MNELIKKLPTPKEYAILPPDMDHLYFENCEYFKFDESDTDFNLVNSWWLAEASFLVYNHPGFARMAFKLAGFENFKFFQGKGTECMVAWCKKTAIIVFRGTEINSFSTLHEIYTDIDTVPVPFNLGGKVHRGFLNALNEIWEGEYGLKSFIDKLIIERPKRKIWITGHSLGGALATLSFAQIPSARGLYIYGTPRVGDNKFKSLFDNRPFYRIEHGRDPIPLVPPNLPQLDFNFADIGKLIYISKDGALLSERPTFNMENHKSKFKELIVEDKKNNQRLVDILKKKGSVIDLTKQFFCEVNEQFENGIKDWQRYLDTINSEVGISIEDHAPLYYSIKLWNNIVEA